MNIIGQMGEFIKDHGRIIKCMEKEYINGQMEEYIMVLMWMIKNKGLENISGQMGDNILENGMMVNNMEKESTYYLMERLNLEYGIKEED